MKRPRKGAVEAPRAPSFAGKLAVPVSGNKLMTAMLRATGPEGQAAIDEANLAMWAECLDKIPLLAGHYGIAWDGDAPDWASLAFAMALDLVPGFQFMMPTAQAPGKPGRPAERNWISLYYRADRLIQQGASVTEACRRLSASDPDFKDLSPAGLVSKFNTVKRSLVKDASDRLMREGAEDENPTDMQKPN